MKKLFLSSFFADSSHYLHQLLGNSLQGKTVAFIPTASEVEEITFFMDNDRQAFLDLGIIIDELNLSTMPFEKLNNKIVQSDMIFVGGGNTFHLLNELRRTGLDRVIQQEIIKGKPYIGTSAGSIILSKDIDYIRKMENVHLVSKTEDTRGLDIIDFYPVPHKNNPYFIDVVQEINQAFSDTLNLRLIDDAQAIIVNNEEQILVG